MRAPVLLLGLLLGFEALAAPTFPALTGRVVDEAQLLSPQTEAQLTQELAVHERETTEQVVVVTVPSLQGYPIEDYGYQLGRQWGIGQAKRNNGAILLVAPNERRVRIEVGYGLEGRLTDVYTHDIIQTQILPPFRQGQFELGIVSGARAVLAALKGSYEPSPQALPREGLEVPQAAFALGALGLFMLGLVRFLAALAIGAAAALLVWAFTQLLWLAIIAGVVVFLLLLAAPAGRGPRGRGFGYPGGFGGGMGGGFSGGGGSFGGGGASGRW